MSQHSLLPAAHADQRDKQERARHEWTTQDAVVATEAVLGRLGRRERATRVRPQLGRLAADAAQTTPGQVGHRREQYDDRQQGQSRRADRHQRRRCQGRISQLLVLGNNGVVKSCERLWCHGETARQSSVRASQGVAAAGRPPPRPAFLEATAQCHLLSRFLVNFAPDVFQRVREPDRERVQHLCAQQPGDGGVERVRLAEETYPPVGGTRSVFVPRSARWHQEFPRAERARGRDEREQEEDLVRNEGQALDERHDRHQTKGRPQSGAAGGPQARRRGRQERLLYWLGRCVDFRRLSVHLCTADSRASRHFHAGTGKSVLLREIISSLKRKYRGSGDAVAVTASTGMAACNIGGTTIHSFAGIGLGVGTPDQLVSNVMRNKTAKTKWQRVKVLVIDEGALRRSD